MKSPFITYQGDIQQLQETMGTPSSTSTFPHNDFPLTAAVSRSRQLFPVHGSCFPSAAIVSTNVIHFHFLFVFAPLRAAWAHKGRKFAKQPRFSKPFSFSDFCFSFSDFREMQKKKNVSPKNKMRFAIYFLRKRIFFRTFQKTQNLLTVFRATNWAGPGDSLNSQQPITFYVLSQFFMGRCIFCFCSLSPFLFLVVVFPFGARRFTKVRTTF